MSTLTSEAIRERRQSPIPTRVVFGVEALYGLSSDGISLPLPGGDSVASGPVCVTIDPDSDPTSNVGLIDFERGSLRVRYGVQAVFPGLFELVTAGNHDPGLLNPLRAVATDDCTLSADYGGWRALGCLDFLQGSVWSGATGG